LTLAESSSISLLFERGTYVLNVRELLILT